MRVADLFGVIGPALAIVAFAQLAARLAGLRRTGLLLVAGAGVLVAAVPVGGLPLAAWLRGVVGDLSVASVLLLGRYVLRPVFHWGPLEGRTRITAQALLVVGGFVLYPFTLGLSAWDPYRLGYGSPLLLAVLFAAALAALLTDRSPVAAGISLAVLGWAVGIADSRNLWDALMDPLAFAWAAPGLVREARRWTAGRGKRGSIRTGNAPTT